MVSELGGSQISSLLETLPGIANVLRSPVADALVGVMRAGAGLSEFRFDDADELIRYAVRRGLMNPDEGDRLLAELREVAEASGKGSRPAEKPAAAPPVATAVRPAPTGPKARPAPAVKAATPKPAVKPSPASKPGAKAARPVKQARATKPAGRPASKAQRPAKRGKAVKPSRPGAKPARASRSTKPARAAKPSRSRPVKSVKPVKKAAKTGRKR